MQEGCDGCVAFKRTNTQHLVLIEKVLEHQDEQDARARDQDARIAALKTRVGTREANYAMMKNSLCSVHHALLPTLCAMICLAVHQGNLLLYLGL